MNPNSIMSISSYEKTSRLEGELAKHIDEVANGRWWRITIEIQGAGKYIHSQATKIVDEERLAGWTKS